LPTFRPFAKPDTEAGFYGRLRGPRTGRIYEIVTRTPLNDYPQKEPGVYINPHPEHHHWIGDGRLCYRRDEHHWNPATDTFAEVFAALGCAMPSIKWLGELHVHPRGMTWLSAGDCRTVADILTGSDDTVHPTEFIAGVMQRDAGTVSIYPYHFARERLKGDLMS